MTSEQILPPANLDDKDNGTDGRRQRSERSRHKIAQAMTHLIMEGELTPSAEAVAERAGVGLRSVFRHFKDMDSLFHEVSKIVTAEYLPKIDEDSKTTLWPDRLYQHLELRTSAFDKLMPMRQSSMLQRYRSKFVESELTKNDKALRQHLVDLLPEPLAGDHELVSCLDLALSFDTWIQLRRNQNLSPTAAQKVVRRMVDTLIKTA